MAESFPDIEVIEQPTYWKTDRATSVAQTVVTSTPDLAGIYMQSDAVMLAGVLNVLKSADRLTKVGEPEHIYLVSIDGTPYRARAGPRGPARRRDLAAAQPLREVWAATTCRTRSPARPSSVGPTDHDSRIEDFNGNLMDLLPAPVVTKANVDDPTLWANQVK